MIQAIVYTSNAGTTEQYAKLIGEKTGLPVYPLDNASGIAHGTEIIYLGWLMAGVVKGYKKAAKLFKICALCGIGMGETGSQIPDVRKANNVPGSLPVFTMRGGFDLTKLHGMYKFMMSTMKKTAGKKLSEKTDRTPDEDIMLDMMLHGGNYVSVENAAPLLEWYHNEQ
ncbi:MAG: hypothetical protein GX051_10715 [Clostridiales bacterium]|nr:hypothetical protein [Clostridiales bacterium]